MEEEKKEKVDILKKTTEETEKLIYDIVKDGIEVENIEYLYQLIDIHKDIKEEESIMYGNYGNYSGNYGNYGNYGANYNGRNAGYDSYGRRGYDAKYRGDESLDRMAGEYGRYSESRNRYGAGEETDKSYHYMVKALEDFIKVLHEEAETPQQKQMLKESLQRSMM